MAKIKFVSQMELDGFADLVKDAEDAGQGLKPPTPAEVRERELAARLALNENFKSGDAPDWTEKFDELMLSNIPWRIAAFIAWSMVPKHNRHPKTQHDFAKEVLGLGSARRITEWRRKYPYIDQMIATMQTSVLMDYIPGSLEASGKVASMPDYKATSERRLLWEAVGIINRNQKITVDEGGLVGKGRKLLDQLRKMPTNKKVELLGEDAEEFFAEMEEEFAAEDAELDISSSEFDEGATE
ncbi:MAG: hypothetical protein DRI32_00415 [Chloroflexi bacterium]|nr:MAG: hypothetical protein DRI32_00415 [Chloroflexota bacterium]